MTFFTDMGNIEKYCGLITLAFSIFYWFKVRIRVPKGYKLPPGPPRKFLIGNLLNVPLRREWQTYHQWSKIYGDLTYMNLCGTSILIVNSQKLASELFEQRGAIYSNRFKSTMLHDLICWDNVITMQPDEEWKHRRSILLRCFSKLSMLEYRGSLEKSAKKLLCHLYQNAEKFMDHSRHAIGALIMEATYGIEILPENDPYIEVAEGVMSSFAQITVPGACLVDFFPTLKYVPSWVPGAGFQKQAKQLKSETKAMAAVPFAAVKNAIKAGNAPPSVVGTLLEDPISKEGETTKYEETIREIGAMIYMGGIDTTESALKVFFLAMVLYPDIQKKAQQELDGFLGGDGSALPSVDDRKNLPYIDALIKEVLRWHPAVPLGFPHLLKEDDIIGEYFVPKNTIVIGNAWSLLHSESAYGDDVDKFNPERFLKPNVNYPDSTFGFGRRNCPGRHLADSILFIMIACILHTFDITPYETSAGPELPDADAFLPGLISHPEPFKCKITPRSLQSKALLEQLSMDL